MDIAQVDRAQALERKFARRAARTQRSKWIARFLFSLTGMGMLLFLRLNPELMMEAVSAAQGMKGQKDTASTSAPGGTFVRNMPKDIVPVRRGGNLPGNGTRAPQQQTQFQADAVNDQLRGLDPTQ